MTNIDKLVISLLKKIEEKSKIEENKEIRYSFLKKSTAVFRFNEYIDSTFHGATEEERESILSGVSDKILNDLIEQSTNLEYDYVGIWLTIGDDIIENSMDLSALEAIGKYGAEDIVPIYELIKMSLT